MKLDLSEIAAHLGKRIRYEIDQPPIKELGSGVKDIEPVKGDATFTNTGNNIVVRGKFHTVIELDCSRCLTAYKLPVDLPIEEELPIGGPQPWMMEEVEVEDLPEEEQEPLFVENIFDLDELIRQQILVNLPIKPLCGDLCKGLCPHCGANLNEGPCECPPETVESPFGALASLMEEEEES